MPDTNEGPAGTAEVTENPAATPADPLPGFAEAMVMGQPSAVPGEPKEATAVETSAEPEAPEAKAETPKEEPAKVEEKPQPAKPINFDGFSADSKTYWENALKAGHATPADVERARVESLFQASWTRNHQKLAKEREAFQAEMAQRREDLALLDKIRGDERLHSNWLKMAKGEVASEETDETDLVDAKKAAEIADKRYDAREAEKAARTAKEQARYEKKQGEIQEAVREQMRLLAVTPEVMLGYLRAEEETLDGVDPILHFTPTELMRRVSLRHEAATAKAEAASLREQFSQRASKAAQTAKQSLPPARRVVEAESNDPLKKTMADLGLAPDWGNVTGFGQRG